MPHLECRPDVHYVRRRARQSPLLRLLAWSDVVAARVGAGTTMLAIGIAVTVLGIVSFATIDV